MGDDGRVVEWARSGCRRRVEPRPRRRRQRQLASGPCGRLVHQTQVLARQLQLEARRVIAAQDVVALAASGDTDRRVGEDLERAPRVETESVTERQRLAEGGHQGAERGVGDELGRGAGAEWSDVDRAAEGFEDRTPALEDGRLAADEDRERPVCRLRHATQNRRVEQGDAIGELRGRSLDRFGPHGGHLDQRRARRQSLAEPVRAAGHGLERIRVGEHREHGVGSSSRFRRRGGRPRPALDQYRGASRRPIPHGELVSRREQPRGHGSAHLTQAQERELRHADLQRWTPGVSGRLRFRSSCPV